MHIRCALLNLDNNKAYQIKKHKLFYLETLHTLCLLLNRESRCGASNMDEGPKGLAMPNKARMGSDLSSSDWRVTGDSPLWCVVNLELLLLAWPLVAEGLGTMSPLVSRWGAPRWPWRSERRPTMSRVRKPEVLSSRQRKRTVKLRSRYLACSVILRVMQGEWSTFQNQIL
jgi:hypothetical protein